MTITDSNIQVSYAGNGVTKDFVFNMKTADATWIQVFEDDVLSIATVAVTLNIDQDTSPGGSVNVDPAPASGVVIDVIREAQLDQLIDYTAYSGFPADTNEQGLDKLTILAQQLEVLISKQGAGIAGISSIAVGDAIYINAANIALFTNSIIGRPKTTTGTAVAYSAIMDDALHIIGNIYEAQIHITNLGSCIIDLGDGFKGLKSITGGDIARGQLLAGMIAKFLWDGTNMILLNPYTGIVLRRLKTTDEIVNNSTVLQDDDELSIIVEADGVYEVDILVIVVSDAVANFKYHLASSDTFDLVHTFWETDLAPGAQDGISEATALKAVVTANTNEHFLSLKGILRVGGSINDLKFQWAQNTGVVVDTIVKADSYIKLTKLN